MQGHKHTIKYVLWCIVTTYLSVGMPYNISSCSCYPTIKNIRYYTYPADCKVAVSYGRASTCTCLFAAAPFSRLFLIVTGRWVDVDRHSTHNLFFDSIIFPHNWKDNRQQEQLIVLRLSHWWFDIQFVFTLCIYILFLVMVMHLWMENRRNIMISNGVCC